MSIETAVIGGVMILISLYLVISPFRTRNTVSAAMLAFQRQRDALLVYYGQVTSTLRDLKEDSISGKLSPEEYEIEYEKWMQRGIQILKVLEDLDRENQPLITNNNAPVEDVNQAIEDAVQQYLKSNQTVPATRE